MVFSDSTNKLGLVEKIDFECDTDSTTFPIAQKTRELNAANEELGAWLLNRAGTWQFDDENYTTTPEPTFNLVAGQSDYNFPAGSFLEVEWAKVKNANGYWNILTPIDQSETDLPLENMLITPGMPQYYDKVGMLFRLYPAPSASLVTLTDGLKLGITRTTSAFVSSDTTKTPGFPSPYHVILAWMASIPYCAKYHPTRVPGLMKRIDDMKKEIETFIARREMDRRKRMTMKSINPH